MVQGEVTHEHTLTPDEAAYIERFSRTVQDATISAGRTPQHGEDQRGDGFARLRGGYAAEVAVARVFGFDDWYPTDYLKPGQPHRYIVDIPGIGGVKHGVDHWRNLLVNDPGYGAGEDPPNIMYFWVTGRWDEALWVHGWMFGFEAQQSRYRHNKSNVRATFFVKQEYLHPITPEVRWP